MIDVMIKGGIFKAQRRDSGKGRVSCEIVITPAGQLKSFVPSQSAYGGYPQRRVGPFRVAPLDINDFVIKLTSSPSVLTNETWKISQRAGFLEATGPAAELEPSINETETV
jgi:hypothetical protein